MKGFEDISAFQLAQKQARQQEEPPLHSVKMNSGTSAQPIPEISASPVKPLNSIMDLHRIFTTPHSSADIGNLWTAYHGSRSGGTGRGFLSAVVPLTSYEEMVNEARRYPTFVLPLIRPTTEDGAPGYEFYFLEWSLHPTENPENSPISTILFTSLAEYKLRQSYAQPHLVITHYTELAETHGIVLLRGELTPISNDGQQYRLSQEDAHLLAFGVQRFFLPRSRDAEHGELLRVFHESPREFKWENLIPHHGIS